MTCDEYLPLTYDLKTQKGDTYRRGVRIKLDGVYEDLTDSTFLGQVRATLFDSTVMFALTLTMDPDQVTNPGLLWLEIPDSITSQFLTFPEFVQIGVYDLEITWPSGDVVTYLEGAVYTKGDVSR